MNAIAVDKCTRERLQQQATHALAGHEAVGSGAEALAAPIGAQHARSGEFRENSIDGGRGSAARSASAHVSARKASQAA